MFSARVPTDREPNRLAQALRRARAAGRQLLDLTVSNPTKVGLRYPPDVLAPLAHPRANSYDPDPRGLASARAAVANDYERRGISVASDRVVLTASTSEAYSELFKLLCDPHGDRVLVPAPSYPLFDHLTRLDGVDVRPYRLEYHGRWTLDESSVVEQWSDRVRAVLAVSPNNPTGSTLSDAEFEWLTKRCAERGTALIVDEVFADYMMRPLEGGANVPPDGASREEGGRDDSRSDDGRSYPSALTFRLGGLSKSAGLPQVKLGWIAVDGPPSLVDEALDRLELICDTYLSVSTPVQVAAPELIARGAAVRAQIQERVCGNYRRLLGIAARGSTLEALPVEGGWSAVVRVPATQPEEELALALLERDAVVVYPGFFFDFPHEAFLVISLLPEPGAFVEGLRRIAARVHG
jgi:aspartate/methionine/tyrosine aminotransferase